MSWGIFTFKVTNGKPPQADAKAIGKALQRAEGLEVDLTIKKHVKRSSERQRRYYFAVIVAAYQDYFRQQGTAYDSEDMHDAMMKEIGGFRKPLVNPFTGEPDQGRISYMDLTVPQTEGYHSLCLQWAAEHGFQIPLPKENLDYLTTSEGEYRNGNA